MTTKLYRLDVPLRVQLEAETRDEARRTATLLILEVQKRLPVGTSLVVPDDDVRNLLGNLELR